MPMSSRKPCSSVGRIAAIAAANLLTFAFFVAAIEFAASLFTQKPDDYFERHWRFNHTWKPNGEQLHTEFVGDNPDFPDPYLHVYNAQGWLEDYDIALEKPAGIFRIFYVGDSFTEGTVPMDESVPSRVEPPPRGAAARVEGNGNSLPELIRGAQAPHRGHPSYHSPDIHFNPRGYGIWADAQLEFLLDPRNDLLPRLGS